VHFGGQRLGQRHLPPARWRGTLAVPLCAKRAGGSGKGSALLEAAEEKHIGAMSRALSCAPQGLPGVRLCVQCFQGTSPFQGNQPLSVRHVRHVRDSRPCLITTANATDLRKPSDLNLLETRAPRSVCRQTLYRAKMKLEEPSWGISVGDSSPRRCWEQSEAPRILGASENTHDHYMPREHATATCSTCVSIHYARTPRKDTEIRNATSCLFFFF